MPDRNHDTRPARVDVPPEARGLALAFAQRGEHLTLVGGAVRDLLLGAPPSELDFATSALPNVTASILNTSVEGSIYRVGEKYGTIGIQTPTLAYEITTYRSGEEYSAGSRKPSVRFGVSIEEDLSRRDFTVNAIAIDPATGLILDPFNGRGDMKTRTIRAVGDPDSRFREDPLRLLRAVRFAQRMNFEIDPETWTVICHGAGAIQSISRERVRDEYSKILTGSSAVRGLTLLRNSGLLSAATPALYELLQMPDHGPHHPLSLWDHTMRVVDGVPNDLAVRWAALLHDIAKPRTRVDEVEGRVRFHQHAEIGAAMAAEVLRDLRYPNTFVEDVALLVQIHMHIHAYSRDWSDGAVRRLILKLGERCAAALALVRADAKGHSDDGTSMNGAKFDELETRITALSEETSKYSSPLTGNDLMQRYQRPAGSWIGTVKQRLLDEVVEGQLRPDDVEGAWTIVHEMLGTPESLHES